LCACACVRQIVEYSTSKTGKHGHAKAKFSALDLFTGWRHEDAMPTSHNVEAPVGALACGDGGAHPGGASVVSR
jgi:hypothetical protein